MSKKKFDPEKLALIVNKIEDFELNPEKEEKIQNHLKDMMDPNLQYALHTLGFYRFIIFCRDNLKKFYGVAFDDLINSYSDQNPGLRLNDFLNFIDSYFRNEFPLNQLKKYAISKIEVINSQKFESVEDKKFRCVENIDWVNIIIHLESHFFMKKAFGFFTNDKNVYDLLDQIIWRIENYLDSRNQPVQLIHGSIREEIGIDHPLRKSYQDVYIYPFHGFSESLKESFFNSEMTEEQFESYLKFLKEAYKEIKKYSFEYGSLTQLQDYIVVNGNSKRAKYLILHDILRIVYPNDFTSPEDWSISRKCSNYTKNNNLSKQAYDSRVNEVKKMIPL